MGCFTSNFGFPDYFWELSRLYPGNLQPFYLLQAFYLLYLGNIYAIYPIFTLYGLFANNLHAIYGPPFLDSTKSSSHPAKEMPIWPVRLHCSQNCRELLGNVAHSPPPSIHPLLQRR